MNKTGPARRNTWSLQCRKMEMASQCGKHHEADPVTSIPPKEGWL